MDTADVVVATILDISSEIVSEVSTTLVLSGIAVLIGVVAGAAAALVEVEINEVIVEVTVVITVDCESVGIVEEIEGVIDREEMELWLVVMESVTILSVAVTREVENEVE